MSDLYLPAAFDTPEIRLNAAEKTLNISGESYPENGHSSFAPVLKHLETELANSSADRFVVNFRLTYFNSLSAKILYKLMQLLDNHAAQYPDSIAVNWYCDAEDDMMLDFAEGLKADFAHIRLDIDTESPPNSA